VGPVVERSLETASVRLTATQMQRKKSDAPQSGASRWALMKAGD
jgi:hypothetical protein